MRRVQSINGVILKTPKAKRTVLLKLEALAKHTVSLKSEAQNEGSVIRKRIFFHGIFSTKKKIISHFLLLKPQPQTRGRSADLDLDFG